MLKKMFLTTLSMVLLISIFPLKYVQADTLDTTQLTNEKRITSKDEVLSYAKKNNLPLEYDGKEIAEIIINTDNEALTQANKLDEDSITIEPRIGDICQKLYPYEGYNTNRIAWSTSGVGPGTISNTVSKETSSEIFGDFKWKFEVVEATVGFKLGQKQTCTSSYSVTLNSGESARVVGYFRYKGYFVKYYTFGGLIDQGTYEVGRPIGIDFIVYR